MGGSVGDHGPPGERPSAGTANLRPFVGRAHELGDLTLALEAARVGHGSLALVCGEPGIGKSRLIEELSDEARATGSHVLTGRCWDGGGAPAYWPWVQVVRAAGAEFEDLALAAEGTLHPLRRPSVPEVIDPDAARFRLFDQVARFLGQLEEEGPVLVALDDLHAADEPSLLLLRFLSTSVADRRLLLVGAYRDAEPRIREASHLFGELTRLGRRVALQGLSGAEIARYIEIVSGSIPSATLVAKVLELTAGNPFFVSEIVRAHREQQPGDDGHRLPEEVRALIRRRAASLSPEAAALVRVAAVVGHEFDVRVLAPTTTLSTEHLIDVLGEADLAGIIMGNPDVAGSYAFAHDLVREAMYEDLSPARRMELHRTIGHVLEEAFEADLEPHLASIAHHYAHSAPLGDADLAVEYSVRAGDEAARLLAYEDAARLYESALRLLPPDDASSERRCEILLRLGDARSRSADTQAATRSFDEAAAIGSRVHAPEILARAALGHVTSAVPVRLAFGGLLITALFEEGTTGIALLEEALRALPDADTPLRARVLARLATELYTTTQVHRRLSLAQEALDMALRLGDPGALVEALHGRHWATLTPDSTLDRLANAQQMLLVATGAGEEEAAFLARHARLHCFLELGDLHGVEAELEAMAHLAARIRQPYYVWHAASVRAMRTLLVGEATDAERQVRQAYETGPLRRSEYVTYMFEYAQMVCVRWTQGRLEEIRAHVHEHGERYRGIPRWRDALIAAELGDEASARSELERHASNRFRDLPRDGLWLLHLSALSQACVLVGDRDRADVLYELLRPFAERDAISISTLPFGPVAMRLGMLGALLGRWDEAFAHLDRALDRCDALGARALRARVLLEYAVALRAQGPDGSERAEGMMREAATICQQLDLTGIGSRIATMLGSIVVRRPTATDATFQREGRFWTLAYAGRTARLRDLRGLGYIADLLSTPGQELHVLELLGTRAAASHAGIGGVEATAFASPQPVLDARAKEEYRRRLHELGEELNEARGWNDVGRVAKLEAETEAITVELERAIGLGGRDRELASPAERARVSVTKAIKVAVRAITAECPALGEHLASSIRTGRFCSYAPPGQEPPRWTL